MSDTADETYANIDNNDGQKGNKSKEEELQVDLINRDPNDLNSHVQVEFHDVIGEPEGAHSEDWVWTNSFKCYNVGKNCCYTCLTFVCAIPSAFCWGCYFACLTFNHIWYFTPCLRVFNMNFSVCARLYGTIVHCCMDPCYEAMSLMFTRIFVSNVTTSEPYQSRPIESTNMMRDRESFRLGGGGAAAEKRALMNQV